MGAENSTAVSLIFWYHSKAHIRLPIIGGFRDTYLRRQVVSRPGGPRAGMGSAGSLGSAASSPSGVRKSNWVHFSLKI